MYSDSSRWGRGGNRRRGGSWSTILQLDDHLVGVVELREAQLRLADVLPDKPDDESEDGAEQEEEEHDCAGGVHVEWYLAREISACCDGCGFLLAVLCCVV